MLKNPKTNFISTLKIDWITDYLEDQTKLVVLIDPCSLTHSPSKIDQVKHEWFWMCNLNFIELQRNLVVR